MRIVRPFRSFSVARGCARVDSTLDTAKLCSDRRVDVDRPWLRAVLGEEKRFYTAWTQSGLRLGRQLGLQDRNTNRALHVIVPGMKQRTLTPIGPYSGQTSVTLALFGSSMTAPSGT